MNFKKFLIVASLCAYAVPTLIGCAPKEEEVEDSTTPPTTAPVASVKLEADSTSQTVSTCFAITATALGDDGSAVSAEADAAFSLAVTAGTGTFYTDSGCTSSTTSATIAAGESELTLYFKTTTIEAETVQATYNSTAGTAWSGTIYGPNATAVQMASTVKNNNCTPVSFYYKDGSSITSLPYNSTITMTQSSGNAVTFYTSNDCSTGSLTTAGTTTFTINANQSGVTLYGHCGSANQNFVFDAGWAYTQNGIVTSGSNSVYYQNW